MIDRETIDRIYAAANIVDIIGEYVTLKRKGANYQACCPFHNEKTPSFVVSPAKGLFHCFGCSESGNAVTFLMKHESMSYPEALKSVAKRYGIEVNEKELTAEEVERNDNRDSMFTLNSWAMDYFASYLLRSDEGRSVGLSYLRQSRGFSDETIKRFGLGFCPSRGDLMSVEAGAQGYKKEFLLSTGLSIERESDHSIYDRFRDRVIFPVHNISGRIVAFGGRTLRTDKKVPKYQNSPESEIYSKKRELYGLFFAKKAIQQHNVVIMVEGYTDVISMHQAGIENVVSSSGTSLTVDQVRLINRFTKNITVIYDGDAAGVKAAIRGIDIILKEGMNVRIVKLPVEHDPDSFARAHTAQEVQDYIRANEEDFLTFKAKLLLAEANNDPIRRAEMISDMVESISQIPDQIRRAVFAKECSKIMEISEEVLLSEIGRKKSLHGGVDRQTREFIQNQGRREQGTTYQGRYGSQQTAPQQGFAPPPDDLFIDDLPAPTTSVSRPPSLDKGSSFDSLEFEILKDLLCYGHRTIEIGSGNEASETHIATVILSDLTGDNVRLKNDVNQTILDLYQSEYDRLGEGVKVESQIFVTHENPNVCIQSVKIFTADDAYEMSRRWGATAHLGDEDLLQRSALRVTLLYKLKMVLEMIREKSQLLTKEGLSDDEYMSLMKEIRDLNEVKMVLNASLSGRITG